MYNSALNVNGKDVRGRVVEALQRSGYKQIDVARETGIHHSTLSLWLQGKIKGHYVKVEETMEEWLENLYSNKPRFSKNSGLKYFDMRANMTKNLDPNSKMGSLGQFNSSTTVFQDKHLTNQLQMQKILLQNSQGPHSRGHFNKDIDKKADTLVPIRIDFEIEGRKYKENICWNINEPYLTPENFAKLVAEENSLSQNFEYEIARNIASYKPFIPPPGECLKVIEIELRIDNVQFKDRFEWDINDINNNPEEFAYNLCSEVGLNEEFASQISHSIREQIWKYRKTVDKKDIDRTRMEGDFSHMKKSTRTLLESSSNYTNIDLKPQAPQLITTENYLRPLMYLYNDNTDNLSFWEPHIEILDPNEIRKHEKLEERKIRYVKRFR